MKNLTCQVWSQCRPKKNIMKNPMYQWFIFPQNLIISEYRIKRRLITISVMPQFGALSVNYPDPCGIPTKAYFSSYTYGKHNTFICNIEIMDNLHRKDIFSEYALNQILLSVQYPGCWLSAMMICFASCVISYTFNVECTQELFLILDPDVYRRRSFANNIHKLYS